MGCGSSLPAASAGDLKSQFPQYIPVYLAVENQVSYGRRDLLDFALSGFKRHLAAGRLFHHADFTGMAIEHTQLGFPNLYLTWPRDVLDGSGVKADWSEHSIDRHMAVMRQVFEAEADVPAAAQLCRRSAFEALTRLPHVYLEERWNLVDQNVGKMVANL